MISLRYISGGDISHPYKQGVIMEGYVAILMPVLLVGVIFFFVSKMERSKYNAIIEVSKKFQFFHFHIETLKKKMAPNKKDISHFT